MEGRRSRLLKGHYRRRRYAIEKCAIAAERRRYRVFAIQHGGWCASSRLAYRTYGRYGKSKKCRNGKGGPWANTVYILRGKEIFVNNDGFVIYSFSLVLASELSKMTPSAKVRDKTERMCTTHVYVDSLREQLN